MTVSLVKYTNQLGIALAKMPPHNEVTEVVRKSLAKYDLARKTALGAFQMYCVSELGITDSRKVELMFELWLAGR